MVRCQKVRSFSEFTVLSHWRTKHWRIQHVLWTRTQQTDKSYRLTITLHYWNIILAKKWNHFRCMIISMATFWPHDGATSKQKCVSSTLLQEMCDIRGLGNVVVVCVSDIQKRLTENTFVRLHKARDISLWCGRMLFHPQSNTGGSCKLHLESFSPS